jgi:hypothetical protein
MDPSKAKKRYIILTHLVKFNQNLDQSMDSNSIREEIEASNDKTHFPLPLSMVEISDFKSLIDLKISKKLMKQIISYMGETVSQSQSSVMQTQSSGFGMATQSFMNQTINSSQSNALLQSGRMSTARSVKQFFSKDNENHPSIEENKKLKTELEHLR